MDLEQIILEIKILKTRKDEIYKRHIEKIDKKISSLLKKIRNRKDKDRIISLFSLESFM